MLNRGNHWCEERESNPYTFRYWNLKRASKKIYIEYSRDIRGELVVGSVGLGIEKANSTHRVHNELRPLNLRTSAGDIEAVK